MTVRKGVDSPPGEPYTKAMDETTNETTEKKAAWRFHRWLELLEAHHAHHAKHEAKPAEQPVTDARFDGVEEQPE